MCVYVHTICKIYTVISYSLLVTPLVYFRKSVKYVNMKLPMEYWSPGSLFFWLILEPLMFRSGLYYSTFDHNPLREGTQEGEGIQNEVYGHCVQGKNFDTKVTRSNSLINWRGEFLTQTNRIPNVYSRFKGEDFALGNVYDLRQNQVDITGPLYPESFDYGGETIKSLTKTEFIVSDIWSSQHRKES